MIRGRNEKERRFLHSVAALFPVVLDGVFPPLLVHRLLFLVHKFGSLEILLLWQPELSTIDLGDGEAMIDDFT